MMMTSSKTLIATTLLLLSLRNVDALSMQQSRSSSRLFLNTPKQQQKQTPRQPQRLVTYPLKSSIPADTPLVTPRQSPKIMAALRGFTPSALSHKAEVRRRRKLYKELQVTAGTGSTTTNTPATPSTATTKQGGVSKMDVALFMTYFCNMAVVTLSVVTVPALAAEYALPQHTAAFVAGVASMAPLGGGVGKLVNGFVCQRLGGRQASWMYLVALSGLSMMMSFTKSLAPIGLLLIGYEFLSSIQWTSICDVLDQHYRTNPQMMARGIALLSLSSTLGALTAKTVGAGLLQATNWRTVCRFGSLAALIGAAAMHMGVKDKRQVQKVQTSVKSAETTKQQQSPIQILKSILGNKLFWMVGLGHSLGHLAKSSDRLLGPFLQETASMSSTLAAGLTSSVTIGMVIGLIQGRIFSKMDSVKGKMKMMKRNYAVSLLSVLGLAVCGLGSVGKVLNNSNLVAAGIALFSGIMASTVSFQFYQVPNLVSANVFPESSAVSLSLLDAAGFFVTAQVLAANNHVLGKFGWSASWTFLAMFFGFAGTMMSKAIQPVLLTARKNQRAQEAAEAKAAVVEQEAVASAI